MRFGIDNLEILEIKQAGDLVKDVDKGDLESNYLAEAIGLRSLGDNYIASRDYGTRHRFTSPPIRPNASIAITGATNATPIVLSTANTDGLQAGDTIYVDEVQGNIGANGTWVVGTVVANTSIELVGSVGNGAYVASTGIWCSPDTNTPRNPITIIDGTTFYDKESQVEYEVVVGLDSAGMTRLFIYDETAAAGQRWIELTRKIDCLINEPVSIGATDQTFDIDTITENSVTLAPATNLVQYWICYNSTKQQTVFITASTATSITVDTIIGSSGLGWANNDVLELYKYPAIKFNWTYDNGTTPDFDWIQIEQQRKLTMLYTNSATPKAPRQPIQVMKRAARNYFYDVAASPIVTIPEGWYVESEYGILNPYFTEQGSAASPISTNDNGYVVTGATNATPIVITVADTTGLNNGDDVMVWGVVGNAGANGRFTIANKTGTTFELVNSIGTGAYSSGGKAYTLEISGAEKAIYNQDTSLKRDWLTVHVPKNEVASSSTLNRAMRGMITVLYGYQESDPVWQGFYDGALTNGVYLFPNYSLNFALMSKEVTAIIFYAATANDTVRAAGWNDSPSEYRKIFQHEVQTISETANNRTTVARRNPYQGKPYFSYKVNNEITSNTFSEAEIISNITLDDALNHAIDRTRSYPTPSFVTTGTREQGSIIAINEGDTKLHLSLYDGYGVHQDDNFPNVATDNGGNKMLVPMLGSSELLGLEILYDTIFAFRNNMIETYDLNGVPKRTYDADVVSKKSITATPYGIVYAGRSSIFIIPSDGSEIRTLNELWNNYYGGNQYVDGTTTQFITDAYRSEIMGDYDMTFKEVCLLIKVNNATTYDFILFRYNFDDRKWRQRILNTTDTIKYFTKRQIDGTFTVGLSKGLLKYPNRAGTYPWQDDVRISGAGTEVSQSKAVPFTFTINVARFNNEIIENIIHGIIVSHFGSSTGKAGLMKVELFANNETVAFDTQHVPVDRRMDYRMVDRRGNIERLKIKFTMPDSSIFGQYDMSKITLGFLSGTKIGNL